MGDEIFIQLILNFFKCYWQKFHQNILLPERCLFHFQRVLLLRLGDWPEMNMELLGPMHKPSLSWAHSLQIGMEIVENCFCISLSLVKIPQNCRIPCNCSIDMYCVLHVTNQSIALQQGTIGHCLLQLFQKFNSISGLACKPIHW